MDAKIVNEPTGEGKRALTSLDIEILFPSKVIEHSGDYVFTAPREDVAVEQIYVPPSGLTNNLSTGREELTGCDIWKFSGIQLRPNEASYLDLPPFAINIDYFGGSKDLTMLFDLLKVVGKSKDEARNLPFRLFFDKVAIGVLGSNYRSMHDKASGRLVSTEQVTRFKKAILESQKPPLILYGHGGYGYTRAGYEEKTLGYQEGSQACSLGGYLLDADVEQYSAILDMSCTLNPDFCINTLQKLLPRKCPPFFGALNPVGGGFGLVPNDTYLIEDHKTTVYPRHE